MTDSTENDFVLDFAQRIANAVACTDEIHVRSSHVRRSEGDIELGIVPLHLRHLFNILERTNQVEERLISDLFFYSLRVHLDAYEMQRCAHVKILSDWTVVGVLTYKDGAENAPPSSSLQ
jgi:hypothetical protein